MVTRSLGDIEAMARALCVQHQKHDIANFAAPACAWLQACGYQGLILLREALHDDVTQLQLTRDAMGLDLHHVSCVFLAPHLHQHIADHGRFFLRNVRHGLYLLPNSVDGKYGIGCPVDPSFALGGERSKNPYVEKLTAAQKQGVEIDDALWNSFI